MKIILGSASPRRRELLAQIGLEFEVLVSNVEEQVTTVIPFEVVEELSVQKAEGVLRLLQEQEMLQMQLHGEDIQQSRECSDESCVQQVSMMVIGADTIVACEGQILGKPKDAEDAKAMLRKLQGRAHEVYTGVTVLYVGKSDVEIPGDESTLNVQRRTFHEATKVVFCPMSEEEISAYVATGDPLDKAGAYGIQGLCARYIQGIEGDYNNVVGLPVGRLYQEIKHWLE